MAITQLVNTKFGIPVDGAYIRVESPTLGKDTMSFHVRKYVDVTKPFFEEDLLDCPYDLDGSNPYTQAYEYLKTMAIYSSAVDC